MKKIFALLLIGTIMFCVRSVSVADAGSHPQGIEKQDCSQVAHFDILIADELQLQIPEAGPDVTVLVAPAGIVLQAPELSINDPPDQPLKLPQFNLRC